ncbi:CDK5RAP1-like protein [Daphnia carinata]|uniref:CDK5RAP1-like protein n=1 Tax=Daphnia carinata TaxID=120202 RepID=UPI0025807D82|nr:CDK5RAP1-like protein [Daphnia carinata]
MQALLRNISWSKFKRLVDVTHFKELRRICNGSHPYGKHTDVPLRQYIKKGPGLEYFIYNSTKNSVEKQDTKISFEKHPYLNEESRDGLGLKVFVEVYGCQMNVNDTEIVHSVLAKHNYVQATSCDNADIIFLMTCAIREGAENKIWHRLGQLNGMKQERKKRKESLTVGIIGCMAERLKDNLLEKGKVVDIVVGPDSYRSLPYLLSHVSSHQAAIDVILSAEETYADIVPIRLNPKSPSAYVSVMRGCDNMCSYCIVPFTRGRERSRPIDSIVDEVRCLSDQGIKEITLLGQNVNSYRDTSESNHYAEPEKNRVTVNADGFKTIYKAKTGGRRFADLLDRVSQVDPEIRIRFTSPHPKDFPDEVLHLINERPNICKSLHLPAQSGNNRILSLMRRNYTREAYFALVEKVQSICGHQVALSSDFICGFCGETEEEFEDTLDLVQRVSYSTAYIFPYSTREKTPAHRRFQDDVPLDIKNERVARLNIAFRQGADRINKQLIGSTQLVLVEGDSRRSNQQLAGRCDRNIKVIFPKESLARGDIVEQVKPGDYVAVKIQDATSQVLKGKGMHKTTLSRFANDNLSDKLTTMSTVPHTLMSNNM